MWGKTLAKSSPNNVAEAYLVSLFTSRPQGRSSFFFGIEISYQATLHLNPRASWHGKPVHSAPARAATLVIARWLSGLACNMTRGLGGQVLRARVRRTRGVVSTSRRSSWPCPKSNLEPNVLRTLLVEGKATNHKRRIDWAYPAPWRSCSGCAFTLPRFIKLFVPALTSTCPTHRKCQHLEGALGLTIILKTESSFA